MTRRRSSRFCAVLMALLVALALAGCKSKQRADEAGPGAAPSYAELAKAHNDRVALLKTMYAYGAVEIRWRDDDGRHFEQGDLDVWLRMPDGIAMQVGKAGERFFWLGGNSEASWFFDLRKKSGTFAEIHPPSGGGHREGEVPMAISMDALLEMMGLAAIPAEKPSDAPQVRYDSSRSAWVLTTDASAGPMRLYLHATRRLPVRVELLSDAPAPQVDGESLTEAARAGVTLYSELPLQRYEYIFMKGRAVDQFPLVPTLVDVYRADETGSIKISVSRPVSEDESFQDGYFNLHWLLNVLQPAEVRDFR